VKFEVDFGGIKAIVKKKFAYVMKWSDPRTWGTDLQPVKDDIVHVPQGMHLLIDESTPALAGIFAQNSTIEFADTKDLTI
jgi:hypothetical protein